MDQFVGTFTNKISCLDYLPGLTDKYLANKSNRNVAGMNTNEVQKPKLGLFHPSQLISHSKSLPPPTQRS